MINPLSYPNDNSVEEIKKIVDQINRTFIDIDSNMNRKYPTVNLSSPTTWR